MGIEIDEPRAKIAAENVRNAGVDHLVTIIAGNALAHDLNGSPEVPPPTHIYLYGSAWIPCTSAAAHIARARDQTTYDPTNTHTHHAPRTRHE